MHDKMVDPDPQPPDRGMRASLNEERQLNARFFQRACAAALLIAIPVVTAVQAGAAEREWRHGLSLFGDLKYKPDFKHFDYVNPNAPKGGSVRQLAIGTFDNFNLVVAGAKGTMAVGVDLVYDTLTVPALDEVSAEYGLLAESVSHPDDFSSVTYRLRPQAKFHDGTPVTPEDVIFSFNAVQAEQPATFRLLSACDEGREDRRA